MNSYTDKEKLEHFAQQIHDSGIDITPDYHNWVRIAFACASQGEAGREPFHLISSNHPRYTREECDKHYTNCLKTNKNQVSIGTLFKIARDFGIELKLPKGRRPKSEKQREEEQANVFGMASEALKSQAEWRYNTWNNRVEFKEPKGEWQPVRDRDLSTQYDRLKRTGLRISAKDVEHIIKSRDFAADYNPFLDHLGHLPEWHEGDPDFIHEFFIEHLQFGDPENIEFYDLMWRKWFVGMVGLWRGDIDENPIVPVLYGDQHIGKTYFVRHILPPPLQPYLFPVNPAAKVDKDFEISMSETPIMFLDEFNVSNLQKSEAYKYAATASRSYLRDSYGHFREMRNRKASLIAATNNEKFIRNVEGIRRYMAVHLVGTVNLNDHPLPYDGAYAQALYLLKNGFNPKPDKDESQMITEHAMPYVMNDDVVEALNTFIRIPDGNATPRALTAGELLSELNTRGFRGNVFNAVNIGKAMKSMGFEATKIRGYNKYRVVLVDPLQQQNEQIKDAEIMPTQETATGLGGEKEKQPNDEFDFEDYLK